MSSWIPMYLEKLDINWSGEDNESPQEHRKIMKTLYHDAKEKVPMNTPEPGGKSVQTNGYIKEDHAGNKVTRKYQTGILIFCNMACLFGTQRDKIPLKHQHLGLSTSLSRQGLK